MNVLLTCAGRRGYLARYFSAAIPKTSVVVGADTAPSAPGLYDCDIRYQVSAVTAPSYIDELLSICEKNKIKLLVSLNDLELPLLAQNREKFKRIGVTLLVSDQDVIETCFDKYKTYQWLISQGIKTPHTVLGLDEALGCISSGTLTWPLIVKPRWGSASIGVFKVHNEEMLKAAAVLVNAEVVSGQLKESSSISSDKIIFQQFIQGAEHGIDVLNDLNQRTRQVMVKQKLTMRSGETDKACLVDNPSLVNLGEEIGRKLKHIGNLDCDVFIANGDIYVLELNPRFGGGYPFSHMAGANFPHAIVGWVQGETWSQEGPRYKYGQIFSKMEGVVEADTKSVHFPCGGEEGDQDYEDQGHNVSATV